MAVELVPQRNEKGQLLPGAVISPGGRGGSARTRMQRQVDAQLAETLRKRKSIPDLVKQMADCIEDPEKDPELRKVTLAVLVPTVTKHELSGTDGGPVEIESREQWARLSEGFDSAIPIDQELAVEQPDATTIEGVD